MRNSLEILLVQLCGPTVFVHEQRKLGSEADIGQRNVISDQRFVNFSTTASTRWRNRVSPIPRQYEHRVRTHSRALSMPLDRPDYCGQR